MRKQFIVLLLLLDIYVFCVFATKCTPSPRIQLICQSECQSSESGKACCAPSEYAAAKSIDSCNSSTKKKTRQLPTARQTGNKWSFKNVCVFYTLKKALEATMKHIIQTPNEVLTKQQQQRVFMQPFTSSCFCWCCCCSCSCPCHR